MNTENTKTIHLSLALAEVNQILDALGQQPYARVFQLVHRIQQQAERQLAAPESRAATSSLAAVPLAVATSGDRSSNT